MKTTGNKRIIIALFILCLIVSLVDVQAQVSKRITGWPFDGAGYLTQYGVDTNDLTRIRQIADSCGHRLNGYACWFLAEHGEKVIIPKIIECYHQSLSMCNFWDTYTLARAFTILDAEQAHPFILAFFDSMIVQNNELRGRYGSDDFVNVIKLLLDVKDYSKYEFFKSLFTGYDRPKETAIMRFNRFAKNPSLDQDAYETVKGFLNDQDEKYRYYARWALFLFINHPERIEQIRQVALNDSSAKNRYWAIHDLVDLRDYANAIQSYKALVKAQIDTVLQIKELEKFMPKELIKYQLETKYCEYAITDLKDINSPYAYKALLELQTELQSGPILDDLLRTIQAYWAPGPQWRDSLTESMMVDTLGSHLMQCALLGWLGNQSFVNQLSQYINDAKTPLLTTTDSIRCARQILQFQQAIDKEFHDSLNTTVNFVTVEGWRFLYYSAHNILNRLPQIPPPGLIVKLINSSGTKLTGGALQYYEGSWKDAVNNNDGTFTITTTAKTLSLRMTYEYGTQTKSNVTVRYDTVVFQTVNAQIQLQNSNGVLILAPSGDTGSVQYYAGAWRTLGTTTNGTATKELLPANYSFRMTYAYASKDKQQDINTNAIVVFQTVNAAVQLQNSQGSLIEQGTVQYYSGAWRDLGTTTNGIANKELLPNNYSFRMTYAYASKDKQQDISTNATVVFQTVNAAVQLQNSQGTLMPAPLGDQGTVQYYSGAWRDLGTTTNGVANKELLPNNYSFRMTYAYASKDKQQDISTNATVVFQTVNAAVQLQNSQGSLIPAPLGDQGTVQYYSGAWRDLGTTTNGVANKELLPNNYSFRMTYAYASKDKQQDIGTNATVVFQTVNATVQLKNSQGSLIDQGTVQYYSGAWRTLGTTTNGTASKELLPNNYSFRMTYEYVSLDKSQDISTNNTISFLTVLCTIQVKNSQNQLVDNVLASYYSGAWRQIGNTINGVITKELLPVNLSFRVKYGTQQIDKQQNLSTNNVVEFNMP